MADPPQPDRTGEAGGGLSSDSRPGPTGDSPPTTPLDAQYDDIAWRVLSDLLRPGGGFGSLPPDGLQHLIGLRLMEEAGRHNLNPQALAGAFDRALRELTGADRPARDPSTAPVPEEPDPDAGWLAADE